MEDALSLTIARERPRLRNFIRRRVADFSDEEDILQEVFFELVEASRLMEPIEQAGAWLFQVARNRIADLFRKRRADVSLDAAATFSDDGEPLLLKEVLPSDTAGPEAEYARSVLLEQLEAAIEDLPAHQREVFLAHEVEGLSFREIAAGTGVNINTLLARKRYAVQHLRRRLQTIHDEFTKG